MVGGKDLVAHGLLPSSWMWPFAGPSCPWAVFLHVVGPLGHARGTRFWAKLFSVQPGFLIC